MIINTFSFQESRFTSMFVNGEEKVKSTTWRGSVEKDEIRAHLHCHEFSTVLCWINGY